MPVLVFQCKSLQVENGVLICMTLCKKWQRKEERGKCYSIEEQVVILFLQVKVSVTMTDRECLLSWELTAPVIHNVSSQGRCISEKVKIKRETGIGVLDSQSFTQQTFPQSCCEAVMRVTMHYWRRFSIWFSSLDVDEAQMPSTKYFDE